MLLATNHMRNDVVNDSYYVESLVSAPQESDLQLIFTQKLIVPILAKHRGMSLARSYRLHSHAPNILIYVLARDIIRTKTCVAKAKCKMCDTH
jgi:hypothetical protein